MEPLVSSFLTARTWQPGIEENQWLLIYKPVKNEKNNKNFKSKKLIDF